MSDLTIPITNTCIPNHELVGAALAVRANTELIQATSEEIDKRSAEILDLIQTHLIPTLNSQMDALRQLLELEIELELQCTLIEGQQRQLWDSWRKECEIISKKEEMIYQTQIVPLQGKYDKLHEEYRAFCKFKRTLEVYFHNFLKGEAWRILHVVNRAKEERLKAKPKQSIDLHLAFGRGYIQNFQRH